MKKYIKMALETAPDISSEEIYIALQTKGDWSKEEVNKALSKIAQKMHATDPHIVVGPYQKTLEEVIENAERKKKEREEE